MSGATTNVPSGVRDESRRASTLSSNADERDEQALIANLLDEARLASRNRFGVAPKEQRGALVVVGKFTLRAGEPSVVSFAQTKRGDSLTKSDLRELAATSPMLLASHVRSGNLRPAQLSLAAELLGDVSDRGLAESTLNTLLGHVASVVREGVVYGLGRIGTPTARETLRRIAEEDQSPGVREAAAEVLSG